MNKPKKQDEDKGKQLIRNSTAEFLIFTGQSGESRASRPGIVKENLYINFSIYAR